MNFDNSLPNTSSTAGNTINEDTDRTFNKILNVQKADVPNDQLGASEEVLQRKLTALQHEERSLLSLISRLRSHQRTLQLEKARLDKFYEESIKKEMTGIDG